MAVLSATCATLAATIAAAQPGDVVVLPLQPARCGYVSIFRVQKAAPGVLVRIHPQQRVGIRMLYSSGIAFEGGILEGAGSDPSRSGEHGMFVRFSSNFAIRNATVGHAEDAGGQGTLVGVNIYDSSDFEVTGLKTGFRRHSFIRVSNGERFRITDNEIADTGMFHARCFWPDGRVELHVQKATCERGGGTWRDGTHGTAIKTYRRIRDAFIARNRITGQQAGITSNGPRDIERQWVVDNLIFTQDYPQGIVTGGPASVIRGNRAGWFEGRPGYHPWGIAIGPVEGTVACENVLERGGSWIPWNGNWAGPCPAALPLPAPPRWVPESVRGATAQSLPDML